MKNYDADCAGVTVPCGVHVEATVGQCEGGAVLDPVAETRMVMQEVSGRRINLVPFVHLAKSDVAAQIEAHKAVAGDRMVGVRMILNYSATDPSLTWPQVARGDYLNGGVPAFSEG
jgi:predicted TIM-barrel fold metal-dependent hydrolase